MRIESTSSTIAKIQARLQAVVGPEAHIVAQIIEAELIVGAVDDGTSVSRALVDRTRRRQIDSDIEPQKPIHRAHPFGVAAGEIIVDRHNVRFAAQRLQTGGQSRHQGFAFSRFHFGDASRKQRHAAQNLLVEMAHAERARRRLAADRERFGQQRIQRFAVVVARAQIAGFGRDLGVGQIG